MSEKLQVQQASPSIESSTRGAEAWPRWVPAALVASLATGLFVLRLTAPPNLLDQDQERPAAYVLDAVKNGHWLCQRDLTGDITSKPPLYTWLCAIFTLVMGRISVFTLYLPGALAAWGVAFLVLRAGRKYFGERAGLFSALACLLSTAGVKQFGLARTDAVFAFCVTAAALLAFRAWMKGGGWTWFWLMAAAATLTKGPLGLVLATGGLWASFWERKSGDALPLRGRPLLGGPLFLLICGGWFFLAYLDTGQALIAKMIGRELIGQAVVGQHRPGSLFWQQPLYYLGRAAPWSLLAGYGFWRLCRHPASARPERRFERFLFCWFAMGLLIFCLASQQRADHLWPIMPAGALIAGRELARLTAPARSTALLHWVTALVVMAVAGFAFYYFGPRAWKPVVRQTIALKRLAAAIERQGGAEFALTHVDDAMTLQIYLNTRRPLVSMDRATSLLRGTEAAFLAVNDLAALETARRPDDPPIFVVLPTPGELTNSPARIVSNRPRLETAGSVAFCFGPLRVQAREARLVEATERELCLAALKESAEIIVTNESTEPSRARVRWLSGQRALWQERVLVGGESWRVTLGSGTAPK